MDLGLRDRVCVVTGSTAGIGLATARLLAGEPERVIDRTLAELGAIDCLVNNVGAARQAKFEDVPDDEWDAYWQLNLMSHVRAIRAALPAMRERGGGSIVNVSSSAGKRPSTGMPHYSVVKAAMLSLSRLVADLYAKDEIRCNAVTPGPTSTDAWLGDGGLADQQGGDRTEVLARVGAGGPLGRLGRPGEIAAVGVVVCDERAGYGPRQAYWRKVYALSTLGHRTVTGIVGPEGGGTAPHPGWGSG